MDLLSNFKPGEFTHYICALKIPLSIRWHLGFQPYIWLHFFSLMFKNRVQYNIRTFIYCSRRWQHAEIWYEPFFMQYFVRPTSKHHALKNYVIFLTIILLDPRWLSYLFWNNDSKKKKMNHKVHIFYFGSSISLRFCVFWIFKLLFPVFDTNNHHFFQFTFKILAYPFIYLHLIFANLQFEISRLMNWSFLSAVACTIQI